jgi:hypothetical protein
VHRHILWVLVFALACAPATRVRRAFAPQRFVTPEVPVGEQAAVVVQTGWPGDPVLPYHPKVQYRTDGTDWISPVEVMHKGTISVLPVHSGSTMRVYRRHVGVAQRDFHEIRYRSGTLYGRLETAIRPLPIEPLGTEAVPIHMRELTSPFSDDRVADGDLVLVEITSPDGQDVEPYLFKNVRYGWRSRFGAGALVRVPLPWGDPPEEPLPPALTVSGFFGYRFRHAAPVVRWFEETFMFALTAGISSAFLESENFDVPEIGRSVLVGGGLEIYQILSVTPVVNASAYTDPDETKVWALALGVDVVQLTKFTEALVLRLVREHPLAEDERERREGRHKEPRL